VRWLIVRAPSSVAEPAGLAESLRAWGSLRETIQHPLGLAAADLRQDLDRTQWSAAAPDGRGGVSSRKALDALAAFQGRPLGEPSSGQHQCWAAISSERASLVSVLGKGERPAPGCMCVDRAALGPAPFRSSSTSGPCVVTMRSQGLSVGREFQGAYVAQLIAFLVSPGSAIVAVDFFRADVPKFNCAIVIIAYRQRLAVAR